MHRVRDFRNESLAGCGSDKTTCTRFFTHTRVYVIKAESVLRIHERGLPLICVNRP